MTVSDVQRIKAKPRMRRWKRLLAELTTLGSGLRPDPIALDHINRDPSDNRPSNLRPVTNSQNQANTGTQKNNGTGFKGVFRSKGKFRAAVMERGVRRYLGCFHSAEEAARAYDEAAIATFGNCALTNADLGIVPYLPLALPQPVPQPRTP